MSEAKESGRVAADGRPVYRLLLFIADGEPNSTLARVNLERIQAAAPFYRLDTEVINVFDNYEAAIEHGVIVTPCLIMLDPPPRVLLAGTLHDHEKVRAALRMRTD